MGSRITVLLLLTGWLLPASEFQDGQAARAVAGQPSFSAHEKGVVARALAVSKGILYAADVSGHVLSFDLSRIGALKTACPVCLAAPQSSVSQAVFEGVAGAAAYGNVAAIANAKAAQVTIWRGDSTNSKPQAVLTGFTNPVSVALDGQRLFVGDAGSHHVLIWNVVPSSDRPPDVSLGVAEGSDGPGADTIQNPAALASDGANLFVADAASHRILIFSPAEAATPQVQNAASLLPGPLAPLSLASLQHTAGAASSVYLNGRAVRVTESNENQLQIQLPPDMTSVASASLWVKTRLQDGSSILSRPAAVRLVAAAPGIFAFGGKEPRTGLLLHAPKGVPLSPDDPGKPGELLTVWATGLGAVTPESGEDGSFDVLTPVHATLNGQPIEVISAALPADATGVYEVRLRLPQQLPSRVTLVLSQNESKSNAVTFPVRAHFK